MKVGDDMLNSELELLRQNYKKLKEKAEKVVSLAKKIEELKQLPEVKEYLELLTEYEKITSKFVNKEQIEQKNTAYFIRKAVKQTDITPRNDYYVYTGTYKYTDEIDIVHSPNDIEVSRYNSSADYVAYYNLEAKNDFSVVVPYSKANEFELKHNIIFPKNVINRKSYFYDLQDEYFETLILESEEKAIQKINKLVKNMNLK